MTKGIKITIFSLLLCAFAVGSSALLLPKTAAAAENEAIKYRLGLGLLLINHLNDNDTAWNKNFPDHQINLRNPKSGDSVTICLKDDLRSCFKIVIE